MNYTGQSVAVLGLGESGSAAARLLRRRGARVSLFEGKPRAGKRDGLARDLEAEGIRVLCGPDANRVEGDFDLAVLSPGIPPGAPILDAVGAKGCDLIGEVELAWRECACPVVGITGTNGKTTTTYLVAATLDACKIRTRRGGNCGPAFCAVAGESGDLDMLAIELSSFQLSAIREFRPKISVFLNFSANHLDWHPTVEEYRRSKVRIFENQADGDFAVIPAREALPEVRVPALTFDAYGPGGDFALDGQRIRFRGTPVFDMADAVLKGKHNAENVMAALAVGHCLGIPFEAMAAPVAAFGPPPHRCEPIGSVGGVRFINDSKSTSLDAMGKALDAQTVPVVLIAGGKDKGFGFEPVADRVAAKCRCAVLIGEMAGRIAGAWGDRVRCLRARDMAEAVAVARREASSGDVVLLSPGTSSFDMFTDFQARGEAFRLAVQQLDEP
jgi:UDP-N-acetylmuramoylalanine--D-glutamate ligase